MTNPRKDRFPSQIVEAQYASPSGLESRIALHRAYSSAETSWPKFVLDIMAPRRGDRVLEVGCGSAWIWREGVEQLPDGVQVVLSDRSEGMVAEVSRSLSAEPAIDCRIADVTRLPWNDRTFNIAIANHMLYLVEARSVALSELARVLLPGGRLLSATNGKSHMRELDALARRHALPGKSVFAGGVDTRLFNLENGREQLTEHFNVVELELYEDGLEVTNAELVVRYVESMQSWSEAVNIRSLCEEVESTIAINGAFRIAKESGVFVSSDPK